MREIIEVPVLSAAVRKIGVPLSLVTRGAGLVFVSGTPPLDIATGTLVKGDIEVQTEASLTALKRCLAAAGTSPGNILMVRIYAANAGFYGAITVNSFLVAGGAEFHSDLSLRNQPPTSSFLILSWNEL